MTFNLIFLNKKKTSSRTIRKSATTWRRWRDSNSRALFRRLPHFECGPFDHLGTSPCALPRRRARGLLRRGGALTHRLFSKSQAARQPGMRTFLPLDAGRPPFYNKPKPNEGGRARFGTHFIRLPGQHLPFAHGGDGFEGHGAKGRPCAGIYNRLGRDQQLRARQPHLPARAPGAGAPRHPVRRAHFAHGHARGLRPLRLDLCDGRSQPARLASPV